MWCGSKIKEGGKDEDEDDDDADAMLHDSAGS